MRLANSGVKLTFADFVRFPDDGRRHELIDGDHCVTPSPNTRHQTISATLLGHLWSYLEQHPLGRVLAAPFDVVLSPSDIVEPDLLYISREREPDVLTARHARGAPDLVVEIASRGTRGRDETLKRHLYERSGVTEYWVVDPEIEGVRIYRRDGEGFGRAIELLRDADDRLRTPLLPDFELSLARLFRA
ncbi:MAG: Uma2 family endonuclease [Vicinamibacterales bacterium]